MSVLIYGNNPANRYRVANSVAYNRNEFWGLISFRAPSSALSASTFNLFTSHDNQSNGLRLLLTQQIIRGLWRTSSDNVTKTLATFTPSQIYTVVVKGSSTEGFVTHWVNGVKVPSTDVGFSLAFSSTNVQPNIFGISVEGSDIELFEAYIGSGSVPSDAQIAAHVVGDNLSVTMPGLTIHAGTTATGTNGTYASQLLNVTGSNHFIHDQGDLTDVEGNQPDFAGATEQLSSGSAVSTARTITISGNSNTNTGTLYIVGDESENYPTAPQASDIKQGKLDDGTTNAAFSANINMTGQTSFTRAFTVGQANTAYKFYVVQDTNNADSFTNTLSFTLSTKKPVVEPTGTDKALYSSAGVLLTNETGIQLDIYNDAYLESGLFTDGSGILQVDLSNYVNTGATIDIGGTVSFDLIRSNGEILAARNQTVTEGS